MALAVVQEEGEVIVLHAMARGPDGQFSMPESEEQVCLALLDEHRAAMAQLEVQQADANPWSTCMVDRERCQVCVNDAWRT